MQTRTPLSPFSRVTALLAVLALTSAVASAQLVSYNQGDLLLGFRKDGIDDDVVINIGQASLYRDATSSFSVNVGNLGILLSDTFGESWYDDGSLQWAVIGSPSSSSTFNGDVANTSYITKERATADTQSTPYGPLTAAEHNVPSTRFQTLRSQFDDQVAAPGNAFATIWNNTTESGLVADWTDTMTGTGAGGLVFGVFDPSLVQGQDANGIDYPQAGLDLYRIEGGMIGMNGITYEGTFRINSTGNVVFVAPEPSRALLLSFGLCLPLLRRRRRPNPSA